MSSKEYSKILFIDCDKVHGHLVEQLIDREPLRKIKASSIKDFSRMYRELDFSLAIVTLSNSKIDEREEFFSLIQIADEITKPIIFILGNDELASFLQRDVKSGFLDFLTLPLNQGLLLGKINLYLKLSNYRHEILKSINFKTEFLTKMSHEIRSPLNGFLASLIFCGSLN